MGRGYAQAQLCLHNYSLQKQVDVYKAPVTDPGKKSKRGILTLELDNEKFVTRTDNTGNPDRVCTYYLHPSRSGTVV